MAEREAEEQRSLQFWVQVRVWQRDQQSTIPLRIDETAQYVPLRETHDAGDTGAGCRDKGPKHPVCQRVGGLLLSVLAPASVHRHQRVAARRQGAHAHALVSGVRVG